MTQVFVNGQAQSLAADTTIAELVRSLGRDPDRAGTAIARNGEVVPRRVWPDVVLDDGDAVEVVTAVGGG
jgi:sulfur carrier protein